jgi:hypothetical protein
MRISRHARNNMRLYGIQEQEVEGAIEVPDRTEREDRGTENLSEVTWPS